MRTSAVMLMVKDSNGEIDPVKLIFGIMAVLWTIILSLIAVGYREHTNKIDMVINTQASMQKEFHISVLGVHQELSRFCERMARVEERQNQRLDRERLTPR